MKFTKMQGAGNDFIVLDNRSGEIRENEYSALAARLCRRRLSIGADGLMIVLPAQGIGDYAMRFYNSDGSLGEMCGNGARCIARYGYEHGLAGETQHVETVSGTVTGRRITPTLYRVRLNDPSLMDLHRPVSVCGRVCDCAYAELGVPGLPHAVLLLPELEDMDRGALFALGRALRHAPEFPRGANVSFVKPLGADAFRAVTYERGVEDFTLACGTGCGTAAAALTLRGLASGRDVRFLMPGGELSISLTVENGAARDIYLTGPTAVVYEAELIEL